MCDFRRGKPEIPLAVKIGIADDLLQIARFFYYVNESSETRGTMNAKPFCIFLGAFLVLTIFAHKALSRLLAPAMPENPQRIVSLAPNLTETLYALGLGPRVVGVTDFCAFPPEVRDKPRVAGFSSINFEALLRAQPDLVVLPFDKAGSWQHLERLGLATLSLDTRSLPGLMEAIAVLGRAAGRDGEARSILEGITQGLTAAEERARGKERPRVLFSIMHSYQGPGNITEIVAVGDDGFFDAMIRAAGGRNAYEGILSFPRLSRESLLFLNPDVIIDVIPAGENPEAARRDWNSLYSISAIKNQRLILLTDEAHTVPGPRLVHTLAKLSQAFHPE